uniref:DNA mismatch repair proteins mutS family domain-containing protein n=1 Tax=viral metagenome TaxID=1070528 RepID=A0A6C0DPQ9_9ZZZZ
MDALFLEQTLGITNPYTQFQAEESVSRWPTNLMQCRSRSSCFRSLKAHLHDEKAPNWSLVTKSVETLEPLLRPPTTTETESYSQVRFSGSPWSTLNSVPFALLFLSIYKSYVVPTASILLPLISWIMPYILLKTFYAIDIHFTEYCKILWRIWNGHPMPRTPEELLLPPPEQPKDPILQMKQLFQNGWTVVTLGQALWQPIQQARHFMKLDVTSMELGHSVVLLKEEAVSIYKKWNRWLPSWLSSWISLCPNDSREAFSFVLDTPFWMVHLLRALGRFEFLWRLAEREDVHPVEFVDSEEPVLLLKEFGDPLIPMDRRVTSSFRLGKGSVQNHAILTGPNRGGKSSILRGILLNVRLAHAVGAAFANKMQLSHFTWIADGLRLNDMPGEVSMFEREIQFARNILHKTDGKGLILYDELFHSTNPPDAIRTSQAFCSQLWEKKHCISIVSTHVYSLAREAPSSSVKQLCVASWKHPDGTYTFSYALQRGICEVSSVDLLLEQNGLLAPSC